MTKSVEIPQEIIDSVIAAVGNDTKLLKQCTLVSSSFLRPSRKQLFSRIILSSDQICQGIYHLLVQNPVMLSFVRSIILAEGNWIDDTSLLAILRLPFCRLEFFSIYGIFHDKYYNSNWNCNTFSSELKDALSNIIHSSTLKRLSLRGITKVPISFFQHITVTTLKLLDISPIDFCDESSLTPASSKGVAPIASHTVIDCCGWIIATWEYDIPFIRLFFLLIRDKE